MIFQPKHAENISFDYQIFETVSNLFAKYMPKNDWPHPFFVSIFWFCW